MRRTTLIPTKNELREAVVGQSLLNLLLKAGFIGLVSFGAPAGVLTALFPRFFFGLTAGITCPTGKMLFDSATSGDETQFWATCVNQATGASKDVTLASLGVLLAVFFLVIFYIALMVLLIQRWIARRKYGE